MRTVRFFLVVAVNFFFVVLLAQNAFGALKPVDYLTKALNSIESVKDYTAIYITQEAKSGTLAHEETMQFKFKKPFAIYMKWIRRPNKGREVLYVKGKYGNKIVAHEGGVLGLITVTVDPNSKKARDSGDSITDAGIQRFLEITLAEVRKAEASGKLKATIFPVESVFGRPADKVEYRLPSERLVVFFDRENHLPIQWIAYDTRGQLKDRSSFKDLNLNAGLSEADFDRKNKAYRFR